MADAYKRTSWTDWVGPLYKKVVIGGHFHYLSDYKTAFPLKANMFQELASRSVRTKIIIRLVYIHISVCVGKYFYSIKKVCSTIKWAFFTVSSCIQWQN